MDSYKTVKNAAEAEVVEKKSRFIGKAFPVQTEEEVRGILERVRRECWDASHNCYAYRVGFEPEIARFSDDGEPGGTAGLPMMNVLQGEGVQNVLVIATRYFGGTLLGTGGLVRAYTESARIALDAAGIIRREQLREYILTMEYTALGRLQYALGKRGFVTEKTEFSDKVTVHLNIPLPREEEFTALVIEESDGKLSPERGELIWGTAGEQ